MRQQNTTKLLIIIFCLSILSGFSLHTTAEGSAAFHATDTTAEAKSVAFEILKARCNGCHVRQNPGKVFTSANMNSLAPNIYEQVFIRKRMPRGTRVRLAEDEYTTLRNWLLTLNIK